MVVGWHQHTRHRFSHTLAKFLPGFLLPICGFDSYFTFLSVDITRNAILSEQFNFFVKRSPKTAAPIDLLAIQRCLHVGLAAFSRFRFHAKSGKAPGRQCVASEGISPKSPIVMLRVVICHLVDRSVPQNASPDDQSHPKCVIGRQI